MNSCRQIAVIILITLATASLAQPLIDFAPQDNKSFTVWPSTLFLEDRDGTLSINDVINGDYDDEFKSAAETSPVFGFTSSAIWMKFKVKKPATSQPVYFTIERVSLWEAELYTMLQDSTYHVDNLGTNFPYHARSIKSNYSIAELAFHSEEQTYYLRIRTFTSLFVPLYLDTSQSLLRKLTHANLFNGIYLGVFIIIIAYNVFAFLFRKQRIYLWYLLYVATLFVYQGLFNTGLGFEFIWPNIPELNRYYIVASSFLGLSMIGFSSAFLGTRQNLPRWHTVLLVLAAGYLVAIVLSLAGFSYETSRYLAWIMFPTFIFLLVLGMISMSRGNINARLFILGWGIFITFYFIFSLWLNGLIGDSWIGHQALFVGSFLEMLIWFSAISDKINLSRITQQEQEKKLRKEIARDFHDELGNQAARLINYVSLLRIKGSIENPIYETLNGYAQNILDGAKDFVWALDPKNDDLYYVIIHLKDFAEQIFNEKGIAFRFYGEIEEGIILPTGYSRQINLIFKEAITNTFKHSEANAAELRFERSDDEVFIILKDNGKGVSQDLVNTSSRGFENMRVRSGKIQSTIEFYSSAPGTTICLTIKL